MRYARKDDRIPYYEMPRTARSYGDWAVTDKVVFLDVDGVLNDEGPRRDAGTLIDPVAVDHLAHIVFETGAEIVLSSSWRIAWWRFVQSGYVTAGNVHADKGMHALHEELKRWDLDIVRVTPRSDTGPDSRPFEIRMWLATHPDIRSFVILDDGNFWSFGWLNRYFVCTKTETGTSRWTGAPEYVRGLTAEHARRAIAILDDAPPLSLRYA